MAAIKNVPKVRFPGFIDAWEQRKLGDLSESFEYGLNAAAKEYDGENKYIRITDINDDSRIFMQDNVTSPDADLSNADNYKLKEGDILFARTGASVGKSYIYKDFDGLVYYAGFLIRARIKPEYDAEYVFQNTLTSDYEKYIRITSQRSGQPGVNAQEYAELPIMVPSLEEQKKIGSFLRQLDNTITLHQRKCDSLKELKRGMLQKMFPKDGESVPEIRFPGFDGDWERRKLGDVFTERHILSKISDEYPRLSFTIEEGVIDPEDRKTNKRDFLIKDEDNKKYLLTEFNDIIYNPANVVFGAIHRNSYGRGCVSPIYRIFYTSEDPVFMGYVVRNESFIENLSHLTEGSVIKLKTLKPEAFLNMCVSIPESIEEQIQIGTFFTKIDELIVLYQQKCDELNELKKGLLQQMFV